MKEIQLPSTNAIRKGGEFFMILFAGVSQLKHLMTIWQLKTRRPYLSDAFLQRVEMNIFLFRKTHLT